MEILLYIIILGLVLNLISNMIWKYLPKTEKNIDVWATTVLILICILLVVFKREKSVTFNDPRQETISDVKLSSKEHLPTQEIPKVDPKKLLEIIRQQQLNNVKESYGEWAYQCFTDDDLNRFVEKKIPSEIANQLKQNNQFLEVILAIKKLQPSKSQKLLDKCLKISRPTWAELGKISREGQTEAGQKAEKMIAKSIVDLVKELYKLPDDEIKKLFI